jgi:glucose/arabinose dehydrogenase
VRYLLRFAFFTLLLTSGVFISMAVRHLEVPFTTNWLWFMSTFIIGAGLGLVVKNCGRGGLLVAIPLSVLSAHTLLVQIWPPELDSHVFRAFHPVAKHDLAYRDLKELLLPSHQRTLRVAEALRHGALAEDRTLNVAGRLDISVFAAGLVEAQGLAVSSQGDLYVSLSKVGKVVRLRDYDGDGVSDETTVIARDLDRPSGLVVDGQTLYVATAEQIVRIGPLDQEALRTTQIFSDDLPAAREQWYHALTLSEQGELFLSVSAGHLKNYQHDWRYAAVLRIDQQGHSHPFAAGLHQCMGLAFHPVSGSLWGTENSPETIGFNVHPDELNVLREQGDYGWPFCYADRQPDEQLGSDGICQATIPALMSLPSLSSPAGLVFGDRLKADAVFRSMVYVALNGSEYGKKNQGFRLMAMPLDPSGRITGWGIDLISGWSVDGTPWGRPQDLVVGPDGYLYMSDSLAGAVYRIRFPFHQLPTTSH